MVALHRSGGEAEEEAAEAVPGEPEVIGAKKEEEGEEE